MNKRKKEKLLPLLLIVLLLPVFVYTSHRALSIIRQSDEEQGAFEALALRVSQSGYMGEERLTQDPGVTIEATDVDGYAHGAGQTGRSHDEAALNSGSVIITAVVNGETVILAPETFNSEKGTIAVHGAPGEQKVVPLSALSDFNGSIVIGDGERAATIDFATVDVQTESVEETDTEGHNQRVELDRAFERIAESARAADMTEPEDLSREILPQYKPLHDQNEDFFGWLKIDDTVIDYPVMYTPEEPEHYLHRDFDGEYSYSGTPFVEGHCVADGNYYIIYAHHMKNGTMFGTLPKYAEREYWEAHPIIRFDTLYEQREYRVVAAFRSQVYGKGDAGVFRYYEYTDLSDPQTFDEYASQALAAALYDTGVDIEYGDELLALSTCNYHTSDGRFVVVARRMKDGEEPDLYE